MSWKRFAVPIALVASLTVAASPATGSPAASPAKRCGDNNVFAIEYTANYEGATGAADGTYVRSVPSRGGCASSWAHGDGQLSTSAIVAQCRTGIEPRFGPYPITLQFAQPYTLHNRADCVRVFIGVSHGDIDPGRAPLFPGGIPS